MSSHVRPDFYHAIESALQRKSLIVSWIEAMHSEAPHVEKSAGLNILRARLQKATTAEEVVNDPVLAAWLPVILMDVSSEKSVEFAVNSIELPPSFEALMHTLRNELASNRRSFQVFLYPMVMMFVALLALVLLSIFIIPSFQEIFREFQLRLPSPTRVIFGISDFVSYHPIRILLLIVLLVGLNLLLWKIVTALFPLTQKSWLLGSLTSGNHGNLVAMSRLSATLAAVIDAGATVPQALRIGGIASQRPHLRNSSQQLAREIESANGNHVYSRVAHNFPSLFLFAIGLHGNGSASPGLLRQLSAMYAERSRNRASWMSSLINPLAILFIGLLIGAVVTALFMPLVSLVTSLA